MPEIDGLGVKHLARAHGERDAEISEMKHEDQRQRLTDPIASITQAIRPIEAHP